MELKEAKFPDVEFLDFDDFQIPNSGFDDLGHLNTEGADLFSIWFNEEVVSNGQTYL